MESWLNVKTGFVVVGRGMGQTGLGKGERNAVSSLPKIPYAGLHISIARWSSVDGPLESGGESGIRKNA
jgi:hypothetical protein